MTVATGHFAVLRRSFDRDLRRPAHPGRDHRVLLRRAARGAGRLRHAGRDHRGDADRARLQADQGGRRSRSWPTPRRSRSARSRSRSSRSPELTGLPEGGPRRDGRPPDADPGPVRPADPRRHGRRHARRPPGLAGRHRRRPRVRARPVRLLELHLGRADRHRRLAARPPARSSRCLQVWSPSEPLRGERRAARGRRSPAPRSADADARGRGRGARTATGRDSRGEIFAAFAPVPDHHRGLLARPVGPDQGLPRRADQGVRLAGPEHPQRRRRGADVASPSSSTGPTPPARCCSSPACSRCSCCASRPAAPLRVYGARWTSSSGRRSPSPPCSRWPT